MTIPGDPNDGRPGPPFPDMLVFNTVDLTELSHALDRARQTFTTDPRQGIGEMLTVLVEVLKVTDPDLHRGHREMMAKLLTALADLDRGLQPTLLAKAKIGHRPQQSLDAWRMRANAVRVAELLEMTGLEAEEANRTVARLLEHHGVEVGRRRDGARPTSVVARWRADLAAGRAPREGQLAYQRLRQRVTGVPAALLPVEARRWLLRTLEAQLSNDQLIEKR